MNATMTSTLTMTLPEQIVTIALCVAGTMLTRFLPFLIFSSKKPAPRFVQYLGKALPCAIFGMLVVYCLKDVDVISGSHGIPEAAAILVTVVLQKLTKKMLVSIAGGTFCYMILVQFVFGSL